MNADITTLRNGLRIITSTMPSVESVALGIWVGVGSRYESSAVSGISHFIEHLLFKGTRQRSARDISQAIEGRGGYLNAFTQEESTCYYARVAYDRAAETLDVLADMVRNPRLDPEEIEKERGVILEEIAMYQDQPSHAVQDQLVGALWTGHPLGRPVIGFSRSLRRQDRAALRAFRARHYVPENMVVSLAGRIEHGAAVQMARRLLGGLRGGRRARCRGVTRKVGQARFDVRARDIEQAHLAMGFRLFGRHDRRRYVLTVLNAVLGGNMSSRLFQTVREKHGLAYSVHSQAHLFDDTGVLEIAAGLDRGRIDKAVRLILREVNRLRDRAVGAAELRRARDFTIGQLRLGLESPASQMLWMGEHLLAYDRVPAPDRVVDALGQVSADAIRRLARSSLRPGVLSAALLAPEMDARRAARLRAVFDAG
jgi:predicted Zn-dependent peptidase